MNLSLDDSLGRTSLIGCVLPKLANGRVPVALCEFREIVEYPNLDTRTTYLQPIRCVEMFDSMAAFTRWRQDHPKVYPSECWADCIKHLLPGSGDE